MASVQRRRGMPATFFGTKIIIDSRGNEVITKDENNRIETTVAVFPQRGSRAEVPGQQQIEIYTLITKHELPTVGLWTTVTWNGDEWDIVAPPVYHHGTRHTRHISVDVRKRP